MSKHSAVWLFFDEQTIDNVKKGTCKYCHAEYIASDGATSSMIYHLEHTHPPLGVQFKRIHQAKSADFEILRATVGQLIEKEREIEELRNKLAQNTVVAQADPLLGPSTKKRKTDEASSSTNVYSVTSNDYKKKKCGTNELVISSAGNLPNFLFLMIEGIIEQKVASDENTIIGFSGGSPIHFLSFVVTHLQSKLASRLYLFPVEERLVPLEHEESNSGQLIRLLPDDSKFPSGHILRIPTDDLVNGDGLTVAKQFESQLRALKPQSKANGFPIFDLLLLGLGSDELTCSLYPGHQLVGQKSPEWIVFLDKPPPHRITVTMEVFNAARRMAFIGIGEGKAEVIKSIIGENNPQYLANQIERAQDGFIKWFIDDEAAAKMEKE